MKAKFNETIIKTAYAKINLFLEVEGKTQNGYHEITTVMQTVSLCDTVSLTLKEGDRIDVITDGDLSLCGKGNIAYKAVEAFLKRINYNCHVCVNIVKKIPVAAGLGGGSCDAGATLLALNDAFYNIFSQQEIESIAKELGADVPFATRGGCVIARGIGDKMQDVAPLDKCCILIVKHGYKKSTKEAYQSLDLIKNRTHVDVKPFLDSLASGDISFIANNLYNAFKCVSPISDEVKYILDNSDVLGYTLCGAGPSVIAIFDNAEDAQRAKNEFDKKNIFAFVAQPVNAKKGEKQ